MNIDLLEEKDHTAYQFFVENHSGSMLYYSLRFKFFLEALLDCTSSYYIAWEGNEILGVLPLMYKQGRYGKVINSLPYYGSNGGVLATNATAKEALINHYVNLIDEDGIASATLIENPLDNSYPYDLIGTNEKDYRIGQLSKIEGSFRDLEELMVLFHSKTRNTIRKPIKAGVEVKVENNMFPFLEKTHGENMESIGGLAKTSVFFKNVQNTFEVDQDYKIFVARYDKQPIAALLVFYFNDVVEYYTPVVVKEFRNVQALSLLITQAMFEASRAGFKWWNWGGTWESQGGVYDFKARWGTSEHNYNYHVVVKNNDIYNATKEDLLRDYEGFYVLPFNKLKQYT